MTRVIFACVHNAGRSQLAAAYFRNLADPHKAQALSAGTQPALRVHPEVQALLEEEGLYQMVEPQKLTLELAVGCGYLITMGCGESCPVVPGAVRLDWPLPDPKGQPAEEVRRIAGMVRKKVEEFVKEQGWGR